MQSGDVADDRDEGWFSAPVTPVSRRWIASYTAAQIAACVSYIPLLTILLPLKAQLIGGADKALALATVSFWGSLVALFANPLAGAISDRTTGRWGRRRPWIIIGAIGTVGAYLMIMLARDLTSLIAGFMLFQIAFNFFFAPLNSLVPDRIPDVQKGRVSGLIGLGTPIGSLVGSLLIGRFVQNEALRYGAISVILLIGLIPFAVRTGDRRLPAAAVPPFAVAAFLKSFWINPRHYPDFAWTWIARFFVMIAYSLVTAYLLYYLQDAVHYTALFPGERVEAGLATLIAISTGTSILSTVGGGYVSDRIGRRKPLVIASSLLMALSFALFAGFPDWNGMRAGSALFGLGYGCFFAVDVALISQVLPSAREFGKHLGVVNLTNIFGQALAPLIAAGILAVSYGNYPLLFASGALFALLGAIAVLPIRSVR